MAGNGLNGRPRSVDGSRRGPALTWGDTRPGPSLWPPGRVRAGRRATCEKRRYAGPGCPIGVFPQLSVMLDLAAFTRLAVRVTDPFRVEEVAREWRNGRRAGFRCQCPKGRGGSNPPSRTQCKEPREINDSPGFFRVSARADGPRCGLARLGSGHRTGLPVLASPSAHPRLASSQRIVAPSGWARDVQLQKHLRPQEHHYDDQSLLTYAS